MRIAVGYGWSPTTAGNHMERALRRTEHALTYVGLARVRRKGYPATASILEIVANMPAPPDLFIWIDSAGHYFPRDIEKLSIPTACYLIDVHIGTWRQEVAKFFDAVFIAQRDSVATYREAVGHDQVYWLPLAAARDVHTRHDLPRVHDVAFVGNFDRSHKKTGRARRLKLLASHFDTNDFYDSYAPQEVGRVYSQARIVFNTSIAGDVTMRVFEGAACGAMVITDATSNGLGDLFQIGQEIVSYEDDADLLEKIEYYLAHEDEREKIAMAGYERARKNHTYDDRIEKILQVVTPGALQQGAPMRKANREQIFQARRRIYIHLHMLDALFDEARAMGYNPLQRGVAVWPCLVRRLLL